MSFIKQKLLIYGLIFSITAPSALAEVVPGLGKAFDVIFGQKGLNGILQTKYGSWGILLIAFYILFLAIYRAGLLRVPVFQGEGGVELNGSGKMITNALTILSCFGIFTLTPVEKIGSTVRNVFGVYGLLGVAVVMAAIIWHLMEDWDNRWLRIGTTCIAFTLIGFGLLSMVT
jgi:hypothetical protein